jgi:DNA-binding transcriptional ArsR family regulator
MNAQETAAGFHALAHALRLGTIRMLLDAGDSGLAAGTISTRLEVAKNTLSPHLGVLTRAGLVSSERIGRSIIYRAELQRLRRLWAAFPLPEEAQRGLSG